MKPIEIQNRLIRMNQVFNDRFNKKDFKKPETAVVNTSFIKK
jgi:hypothetical protein